MKYIENYYSRQQEAPLECENSQVSGERVTYVSAASRRDIIMEEISRRAPPSNH